MPNDAEKKQLHERDGYHCRFCGVPVIRKEVRSAIKKLYPNALQWERKNIEQHAAFQAMWLQYDHVLPHARGGNNDLENVVITCAPCNFGRMDYLMEEVGISDPREREPVKSSWDGLERILRT
ncbi:MAG: HNH endonuclease [Candidatus Thiodiazotropha endolucinida]|nr:HNH endonuclease [Candidatus Thiodiazotropha taylori]MCG8045824.1 HNH endonuclease [Candidatus Thiodiazotropha taylori]MCG8049827.1 HNH endonuclease [Candidatus Thiodiazotropha taylori]MCW4311643.1 HNH endonuclease [Candidatus Thiodiazotropha taylori]MCW4323326.1 HNH endonuclease [Candidatus Thiodiazotropha taylori]